MAFGVTGSIRNAINSVKEVFLFLFFPPEMYLVKRLK